MSKSTNRDTPANSGGSIEERLARLLDTPVLARVVPHLAPETLHQLIQHRGLDACGELLTSSTPAQLTSLLDLDLWRHPQPGRDEQFDVDRFGEWLEVLVDTGDAVAARTVAALDTHLVVAGLSHYLRVFDPGTFEPTASSDDEPMDRHEMMSSETSSGVLEWEVGGYLVRARRTGAWDAIVSLLVTLDTEHNQYFHEVMDGCRRLSNSRPEIDGLDELLLTPEQHQHDLADERKRRQSQLGYASPADARAFLRMARESKHAINPIAAAYFRAVDEEADAAPEDTSAGQPKGAAHRHVTEAGAMPERPRALLEAAAEGSRAAKLPLLWQFLEFVLHHDETAYVTRNRELAFLANTLLAGCSVQSRSFTPHEAAKAAACICNLGLESWPARWPGAAAHGSLGTAIVPHTFFVDHTLVAAFEVGWSVLYEDVSLFVADRLVSTLTELHGVDVDTGRELRALQRRLAAQREAGTPWLARDAAGGLALLDTTVWISVMGLLDECPILPAAVTAVLERRTTRVSPTAFEFISTTAQIGDIRVFMRTLPSLLSS